MEVKLEHYRVFREVARQGGFSAAAGKLFVSQSAVSPLFSLLQFNIVNQAFHNDLKTFFFCQCRSLFILRCIYLINNIAQNAFAVRISVFCRYKWLKYFTFKYCSIMR